MEGVGLGTGGGGGRGTFGGGSVGGIGGVDILEASRRAVAAVKSTEADTECDISTLNLTHWQLQLIYHTLSQPSLLNPILLAKAKLTHLEITPFLVYRYYASQLWGRTDKKSPLLHSQNISSILYNYHTLAYPVNNPCHPIILTPSYPPSSHPPSPHLPLLTLTLSYHPHPRSLPSPPLFSSFSPPPPGQKYSGQNYDTAIIASVQWRLQFGYGRGIHAVQTSQFAHLVRYGLGYTGTSRWMRAEPSPNSTLSLITLTLYGWYGYGLGSTGTNKYFKKVDG